MSKTKRQLTEQIRDVDIVIEVRDARAPQITANPILGALCGAKPRLIILNKSDLADPSRTQKWIVKLRPEAHCIPFNATQNTTKGALFAGCQAVLTQRNPNRKYPVIRALIVGIPNVGKSLIINQFKGKTVVKTGNRPGVTRGLTWIRVSDNFQIIDSPGVLWPKFDDLEVGTALAALGAIKDDILDAETVALWLIQTIITHYPNALTTRYGIPTAENPMETLSAIAKKRGVIHPGSIPDTERMSAILLSEFRTGKLGKISLE